MKPVRVRFIPALRFEIFTPLIDLFIRLGSPKHNIRLALARLIAPHPNDRILDFGCGTGSLLLAITQIEPMTGLSGVDIDPKILTIATKKLTNSFMPVELRSYDGEHLPYQDHSFTKVVSSLVFHHLSSEGKRALPLEIIRVLEPGGIFLLLDFGRQFSVWGRLITRLLRRIEPLDDNLAGRLPSFLSSAGFADVKELVIYRTLFGDLTLVSGRKAQSAANGQH